jgi:protein gp37
MGFNSAIEWTNATWNPVTGCTKISRGCRNCYAERLARRLQAMGQYRYARGFRIELHHDLVDAPLRWPKPRMIFVNSMSDLFHEEVPEEFILSVFGTMVRAKHHVFQVLTKRSRRLVALAPKLPWPQNVWAGVTVEARECMSRIEDLQAVPARVRFLSLEPLLTEMPALPLSGIGWVIVGGESGPGARLIRAEWVKEIRDQCVGADVPFFFKQWGGTNRKAAGRLLDGRTWDEFPLNNQKASRY